MVLKYSQARTFCSSFGSPGWQFHPKGQGDCHDPVLKRELRNQSAMTKDNCKMGPPTGAESSRSLGPIRWAMRNNEDGSCLEDRIARKAHLQSREWHSGYKSEELKTRLHDGEPPFAQSWNK